MEELEPKESLLQRRIGVLITVLLILSVMLCLYVVLQVMSTGYVSLGGFMLFRVVTGSMEPTIPTGALLIARKVEIGAVRMNDIVCFRTQAAEIWGQVVTHRVVGILEGAGELMLETKGDANLIADGYYVTQSELIGRVVWHTKENNVVASIFSFFTNKIGFLACIVFPCLLLSSFILRDCVKNIHTELEELKRLEREGPQPPELPEPDWASDPLCSMTAEEYEELYVRLREELMAELIEELIRGAEEHLTTE